MDRISRRQAVRGAGAAAAMMLGSPSALVAVGTNVKTRDQNSFLFNTARSSVSCWVSAASRKG